MSHASMHHNAMSATALHDTHTVVYFDFETTGLETQTNDVIELAAVVDPASIDKSQSSEKPETLFKSLIRLDQHSTIPESATRVHGITTSMLNDDEVESFVIVWAKFIIWLDAWRNLISSRHRILLIAHNCFGYDRVMIDATCRRHSIVLPRWLQFSDSLIAIRSLYVGVYKSYALQKLALALGIDTSKMHAHRAEDDVRLLMDVITRLPQMANGALYATMARMMQPKVYDDLPAPSSAACPPMI